jgi:hypothetical protein
VQIDKLQGNALSRTLRDAFLLAAPGNILEAAKIFELAGSAAKPVNNQWTKMMTVEEPRVKVQREPRRH